MEQGEKKKRAINNVQRDGTEAVPYKKTLDFAPI